MDSLTNRSLRVAIAIPTYNRDEILIDTLHEVFSQRPPPDELLVIDQSETHTEAVQSQLDAWYKEGRLRYIRQFPPGLPAARNRALRETQCDVVIFIDDDVILTPGFIEAHRRNYVEQPEIVAVAGRVSQRIAWPDIKRPPKWPQVMDYRYFRLDGEERVEGIANFLGCNHSVRVDYARTLGGYDEEYRGVALREESDFALRIYSAGGVIVFAPMAALFHLAAPSGGCRKRNPFDISGGLSVMRFAIKHRQALGHSFYHELWHAVRLSVLTKDNMVRLWLLPILSFRFLLELLILIRKHNKA